MNPPVGDTKLVGGKLGDNATMRVNFPTDLSRSLIEAGYERVQIFITEEGILLKPYKGNRRSFRTLPIPESWDS